MPKPPIERRAHPTDRDGDTFSRLETLEAGQLDLKQGHARLEDGHKALGKKIDDNTATTEKVDRKVDALDERLSEFFKKMDTFMVFLTTFRGLGQIIGWWADLAKRWTPLILLAGGMWIAFKLWLRELVK